RFQRACKHPISDPQMNSELGGQVRRSEVRQETVFTEMITRIRDQARLSLNQKHTVPLIIVLTKFDAWKQLVDFSNYSVPWNSVQNSPLHVFNGQRVETHSQALRNILLDLIPDLVSTAETFAEKVTYIAVSATGGPPVVGPPMVDKNGNPLIGQDGKPIVDKYGNPLKQTGYYPGEIKPVWVEVPFLYAQIMADKYSVPLLKVRKK
ncbi:MAG: hypothetical protein ACRC2T_15285, partial [Thermoguttaceae bacterium]